MILIRLRDPVPIYRVKRLLIQFPEGAENLIALVPQNFAQRGTPRDQPVDLEQPMSPIYLGAHLSRLATADDQQIFHYFKVKILTQ
jgi:hypothetical protein